MREQIAALVHEDYWKLDLNCARTTLHALSLIYSTPIEEQTSRAAIGLHGAGGLRAQCGLVEGALMFIGLYFSQKGEPDASVAALCKQYAQEFIARFSSLTCQDLRPQGFSKSDPPHLCETLTAESILFAAEWIAAHDQK